MQAFSLRPLRFKCELENHVAKRLIAMTVAAAVCLPLQADDWTKELKDRAKRASLHDAAQIVRGDSGKWNDDARLQHMPPMVQKPAKMTLDAWADQFLKKKPELTDKDDNWLIFRSQQIDDNDRIWVERIERRGDKINVTARFAKWQGKYFRNFTYYPVIALNLGKLEAGRYDVTWTLHPYAFAKFDGDGKALDANWPADEKAVAKKAAELRVSFTVAKSAK
jgi:hypothetical protein